MTAPADVVVAMTGFARALRSAGVAADRHRLGTALEAIAHVDPFVTDEVYWATRLTLCSEPDDLPVFDAVFDAWFRGRRPDLPVPGGAPRQRTGTVRTLATASAGEQQTDDDALRTAASEAETLRHRDVADLSPDERAEVQRMIALLRPRVARRPGLRRAPHRRGEVDVARTVRRMLRSGGEPGAIRHRRRRERPRRLVLLLDVSGSMSPYADVLLRFAHAAVRVSPATTEVFTVGTRLTRVTRQLRLRDADLALRAAGDAIADWSGGTRLGEALQAFLDRWGQRGTARGAVVVLASDGWERGDALLLGEQMARLQRLAHAVVWVNPHKGKDGFAPATAGMLAALPHLDELVAGHSLDALHQLAEVIARA
ncbi:MAG: vWA domain-containing protein [Jatrophihabitans sp.]|uniref:vWA domain-containing protein n=1 Tax=Jatrophihabitans sp. TaxID=1932789 RepID=UPI003F7F27EF